MDQSESNMEASQGSVDDNIVMQSVEVKSEEDKMKELVEMLKIPTDMHERAQELMQQIQIREQHCMQGAELYWYACLLYITSIEKRRTPYGSGDPHASSLSPPVFTVSDLLTTININMAMFLKLLKALRTSMTFSPHVLQTVTKLEKKFLIDGPFYCKFEKIFDDVFLKDESFTQPEALITHENEGFAYRKKLGWLLFVHAKACLLEGGQELYSSYLLLLASVDYVMSTTPAFQLKPPFDGLKMESTDGASSNIMLTHLCHLFSGSTQEVVEIQTTLLTPFINALSSNGRTLTVEHLESSYKDKYRQEGDIDETRFLLHDPHLTTQLSGTREANNNSNQNTASPAKMAPPVTPIRARMTTIGQLRTLLDTAQDGASPALLRHYRNCPTDPSSSIEDRLSDLSRTFCAQYTLHRGGLLESFAQERYKMAVRLYYRLLERLLQQEEQRLSAAHFSQLLHNATFHRCLLACAVEVVIKTYGASYPANVSPVAGSEQHDLLFPWILKAFHIQPFDFVKVLECFVKAESQLPKEIVKHLQSIENQIVESLAWQTGSPVLQALSQNGTSQSMNHDLAASTGVLSSPHLYLSPHPGSLPSSNSSPSAGGKSPRRSSSLNMFLNKVCLLGHVRLTNLCSLLEISNDLQHRIWKCFEYVICNKHELMRDRHLDQLLMCCIFAVCRVTMDLYPTLDIKFKTIVNMYKSQPHARRDVYKRVLISGDQWDSIIAFYNHVFMHSMKTYLTSPLLTPNQHNNSSNPAITNNLSPVPNRVQSLTASPVYSLPGRQNFFISPLKKSPAVCRVSPAPGSLTPTHMTPRSRHLYSIGDSIGSAEKLRTINESMRAINKRSPTGTSVSRVKRLKFDDMGQPGDGGVDEIIQVRRVTTPTTVTKQPSFSKE